MSFLKKNEKLKNFIVTNSIEIKELQSKLVELEHEPTGARVIHISNDDEENLFCLSFQTLPKTSNGVAHILEHTVLCGSDKYPIKDPFFSMTRRSLNTYMNALTGSDFTCFPAASQIPKDFYNLLDVYIDAVFHPKLKELSFLQEGHRLEFEEQENTNSPLAIKGVVYNEMKGAMATPDSRLSEAMHEAIFPNLTYGINSGGNPKEISTLTYRELREFFEEYYHPSRCIFFFYGNMPMEGHLDFIEEHALKKVKKASKLKPIPLQPRFKQPIRKEVAYPVRKEAAAEERSQISFGFLTCSILEQEEILALNVLLILLMFSDASPLKKALLKSGLCKQATAALDAEISEIPLFITMKGCDKDDADKLEKLVFDTLEMVIKEGISKDLVENAIHQLELHRSEITGDHAPFGLNLYMRSVLLKHHGGKPEDGLVIHSLFNSLRKKINEDKQYLPNLLRKHLIRNPHFARITMVPDPELEKKEYEDEIKHLKELKSKLSDKEKQKIVKETHRLEQFQKEQDEVSLDILPKVTLHDVPNDTPDYLLTEKKLGNLTVHHHDCFTNGIVYADLVFDLPDLEEEDLFCAKLLSLVLAQMGCGGRTYSENLDYIQAHTGGISAAFSLNIQAKDNSNLSPVFSIHGKALYRKADKFFTLLREMAAQTDLSDKERLKEVIHKHFTSEQSHFTSRAMGYAMKKSASGLDLASKIGNAWYGIDYYLKLRSLVQDLENQIEPLAKKLQSLQQTLLCLNNMNLVLSCNKSMYVEIVEKNCFGIPEIKTKSFIPFKKSYKPEPVKPSGYAIASPVAFTSKAFKTVSYTHKDTPALDVAAHLFDNLVLHKVLREQGGAYGGGAVKNDLTGNFFFFAYRDPNIRSSLQAFEEAVDKIANGAFTDSDLEEAQLEVIQSIDSPISPGSRAHTAFCWMREGKTKEIRQAYRDKLLKLTKRDVMKAVKAHIKPNMETSTTVVFAGPELLEKENKELKAALKIVNI